MMGSGKKKGGGAWKDDRGGVGRIETFDPPSTCEGGGDSEVFWHLVRHVRRTAHCLAGVPTIWAVETLFILSKSNLLSKPGIALLQFYSNSTCSTTSS
jgi:hypothetical protein